jgi:hypothetical protein
MFRITTTPNSHYVEFVRHKFQYCAIVTLVVVAL